MRPAGCASELPGPGCEADDCTPSAPSAGHKNTTNALALQWTLRHVMGRTRQITRGTLGWRVSLSRIDPQRSGTVPSPVQMCLSLGSGTGRGEGTGTQRDRQGHPNYPNRYRLEYWGHTTRGGILPVRAQCCATACKREFLEHLECSRQPHIQGRGAKKRTQRAG